MNLNTNKILYADIIQGLRSGAEILMEEEHGILIRGKISKILYSAAESQEAAERVVACIPQDFEILVAHDLYTDLYLKKRGLHYDMECYHSAYIGEEAVVVPLPEGYQISRLDESCIDTVIEWYAHSMESLANPEYIGACMNDGMYGIWKEKELCGFIGVHDQESIGLLEIHPKYRRQGLGVCLIQHMINEQLHRGRLPYGEIVTDNIASIKLQEKTSMKLGEELTYWYFP